MKLVQYLSLLQKVLRIVTIALVTIVSGKMAFSQVSKKIKVNKELEIIEAVAYSDTAKKPAFLNTKIVIAKGSRVSDIVTILLKKQISVCTEYFAEKFSFDQPNEKIKYTGELSVGDLFNKLRHEGFKISVEERSVLIMAPRVTNIEKLQNPLDKTLASFEFEGDREEFLQKMMPYFHQLILTSNHVKVGNLAKKKYKLSFKGKVTVRNILKELTTEYGVAWSARIYCLLNSQKPVETDGLFLSDSKPLLDENGNVKMGLTVRFSEVDNNWKTL